MFDPMMPVAPVMKTTVMQVPFSRPYRRRGRSGVPGPVGDPEVRSIRGMRTEQDVTAYVIVELSVADAEKYETYKPLAQASVASHGGTFVVRGGTVESVEGAAVADRVVVLAFADLAAARTWYESPDYQAALAIRRQAATTARLYFVEGV
jgi:uncharacterized protein (DUF1330 family)